MSGTHHFLTDAHFGGSIIHRLDPRVKITGMLGLVVVAVSTPARSVWSFAAYGLVLASILGLSRLPLGYVARRALVIVPFVLMVAVFLPFFQEAGAGGYSIGGVRVSEAGILVLWNTVIKATIGILSVIILASTTSFAELISGMEALKVPRIFTLIISFMYRYAFVLIGEFRCMHRAFVSRNGGLRHLGHAGRLGPLVGSFFLRSYDRGERVHIAMVSRGYSGKMKVAAPHEAGTADVIFLLTLILLLALIRISS